MAATSFAATLATGVDTIAQDQELTFELYARMVLPFDGFVFWVKASALNQNALANSFTPNQQPVVQNQTTTLFQAPFIFTAKGSLHTTTDTQQQETFSSSTNRVVFTSERPVRDLNSMNEDTMYICTMDNVAGGVLGSTPIRFAFSSTGPNYQQAELWHYIGHSITSSISTQIVDDPTQLYTLDPFISNSLPIWLRWNTYNPPWPVPVPRPLVPFYPSFLVPLNAKPPYVSVHIDQGDTETVQSMPLLTPLSNQTSLMREHVRLTLYGCNNRVAQDILYGLLQYSYDTDTFGICNMPAVKDEKQTQVEFLAIALKKRIQFEISYNQQTLRNVARQMITESMATVIPSDFKPSATVLDVLADRDVTL